MVEAQKRKTVTVVNTSGKKKQKGDKQKDADTIKQAKKRGKNSGKSREN